MYNYFFVAVVVVVLYGIIWILLGNLKKNGRERRGKFINFLFYQYYWIFLFKKYIYQI